MQKKKVLLQCKVLKSSDWLSTNFGVRFRYNALGDLNTSNIVSSKESFGITEGVKSVSMHADDISNY